MGGHRTIATQEDLKRIANQLYMRVDDVCEIAPLTRPAAYKLIKEIIKEMEAEGLPQISTRPLLAPTSRVLKKLGLVLHATQNTQQKA